MLQNKAESIFQFATDKNIERAERRLMKAVVQDAQGVDYIYSKLEPRDFLSNLWGLIFATARESYENANKLVGAALLESVKFKIDVTAKKAQEELEQVFSRVLLKGSAPLEHEIRPLVDVVKKASIVRQLKHFAQQLQNGEFKARDDRFEGYLQAIQDDFIKITQSAFLNLAPLTYDEIGRAEEDLLRKVYRGELTISGLSSGFDHLDQLTSGWKPGELIIVAARPGRGKTALLINFLANATKKMNQQTDIALFFSLEMRDREIYHRHLMHQSQISYTLTNRQRISNVFEDLMEASKTIRQLPIKLLDYSTITLNEIRAQISEAAKNYHVKLVIIDYLQLVNAVKNNAGMSRQQEVTLISKSLKSLAKEFNVPVIAAAQLSRRIEERKDSKPILSDLRESGSIEQDADMVMFIHRDNEEKNDSETNITDPTTVGVELILEKNRNGPTGTVQLSFRSSTSTFTPANDERFYHDPNDSENEKS